MIEIFEMRSTMARNFPKTKMCDCTKTNIRRCSVQKTTATLKPVWFFLLSTGDECRYRRSCCRRRRRHCGRISEADVQQMLNEGTQRRTDERTDE